MGDLAGCLIKASEPGQVWCNTNANATAPATTAAIGTGVDTLSAASTGADSTSSATSNGVTASSTANAAGVIVPCPLPKSAIGMIGLLFAGSVVGHFM